MDQQKKWSFKMKKTIPLIMAVMLSVNFWGCRHAEFIAVGSGDLVVVDGVPYELISSMPEVPGPDRPEGTGLMWEWDGAMNQWKTCICQMVAFRALQAFGEYTRMPDIHSEYFDITTGWNTDGSDNLMKLIDWKGAFLYADPITDNEYLTLDDAWYDFATTRLTVRIRPTADNYHFVHDTDHDGYHEDWDFFDYRTAFKTGSGTTAEKNYFKNVVRPQIVNNFKAETIFEIRLMHDPRAF
jgi:hypothetical protein